jgi:hypothetical protein
MGLRELSTALRRQSVVTRQALSRASSKLARLSSPATRDRILRAVELRMNAEGWPQRVVQQRFEVEADRFVGGLPWAALAASTVAHRIRSGYGVGPILFNTGRLKAAAISAARGKFRIRRPGTRFSIGQVSVPYARYHQSGTGRMPKRAFFDNPSDAELAPANRRAAQLIADAIRRELRR